jgi:hypothetical protein
MESDCCGAYSDCSDDIDICPDCGEHADWNNTEDEYKWVVLHDGNPLATKLSYDEAVEIEKKCNFKCILFYDEYYEFTELEIEN